jgi:chromate transporter
MSEAIALGRVPEVSRHEVSLQQAAQVWLRVALLSFGGPAGQIAVMHRILVEEKAWISEERFLHALNYCMLLPGPEAQQLATYIGWLMHRTIGGIVAGGLFVVPGIVAIMALSYVYAGYGNLPVIAALFFGLKAAVFAIVLEAVLRIGKRAPRPGPWSGLRASPSWRSSFSRSLPRHHFRRGHHRHPCLAAGPRRTREQQRARSLGQEKRAGNHRSHARQRIARANAPVRRQQPPRVRSLARPLARSGDCAGRCARQRQCLQPDRRVLQQSGRGDIRRRLCRAGLCRAAGRGYLWLGKPDEMLDGLGMAETTPGPLIMVLQFVGFMAAYHHSGGLSPMLAGTLGGLLATWVTFTPCFLWIFLGAPFVETLRANKAVGAALAAVTAAVVGVILNLAVWFAVHNLFRNTTPVRAFPLSFVAPDVASVDAWALALSLAAAIAIFRFRVGMIPTLAACCAAGVVLFLLGAIA